MNANEAIYTILTGNSAVYSIVGNRVYPLYAAQSFVAPFVTYQLVNNNPSNTKTGASLTDELTYQINCVGLDHDTAYTLKEAVRLALDYATTTGIQHISFQGERSSWDNDSQLQGAVMFSQDYMIREIRYSQANALELTFDDILNVPVANANSISDWNTFFDLPTYGTPFEAVLVSGNTVKLYGGSNIILKDSLFDTNNVCPHLLEIDDKANCIVKVNYNAIGNRINDGAINLTKLFLNAVTEVEEAGFNYMISLTDYSLNSLETIGVNGCASWESVISINIPSILTIGNSGMSGFINCTSLRLENCNSIGNSCFSFGLGAEMVFSEIYIPSCLTMGNSVTDDTVFQGISGQTITLTVPSALMTCNSGAPHASIQYLIDNNTVTVITV